MVKFKTDVKELAKWTMQILSTWAQLHEFYPYITNNIQTKLLFITWIRIFLGINPSVLIQKLLKFVTEDDIYH